MLDHLHTMHVLASVACKTIITILGNHIIISDSDNSEPMAISYYSEKTTVVIHALMHCNPPCCGIANYGLSVCL